MEVLTSQPIFIEIYDQLEKDSDKNNLLTHKSEIDYHDKSYKKNINDPPKSDNKTIV